MQAHKHFEELLLKLIHIQKDPSQSLPLYYLSQNRIAKWEELLVLDVILNTPFESYLGVIPIIPLKIETQEFTR